MNDKTGIANRSGQSNKNDNGDAQSIKAFRTLLIAMALGGIGIIVYSLQSQNAAQFLSVVSVGSMTAGACLVVGGILGFLFGIPRTLQQDTSNEETQKESETDSRPVRYRANTNLEQISDWLTKILVGVGLTQLTSVPDYLARITSYISPGLGGFPSSATFSLSIILYFLILGFLFSYLWSRLHLMGAFRQADLGLIDTLKNRAESADKKIDELKRQPGLDAQALNLVYNKLNPREDIEEIPQEELTEAIKAATTPVKVQIFNRAWDVRADNWNKNKPLMEQTIPIFRALILSDVDNKYHMNHGQLGFALKDQQNPDWKEAEAELTTAINMRNAAGESGWVIYEYNRAICRIKLDEAFGRGQPSDDTTREKIASDLNIAFRSKTLRSWADNDESIKKWRKLNKF